ncbi:hypothetical protein [Brevundimonas sp.]|uniref:hypothetical protein n=1 Tax=Brevundimonas sp. TaxID=1871086 RepID=UPI0025E9EBCE|nr:hypothetical protein [Brevundimonas sp.]
MAETLGYIGSTAHRLAFLAREAGHLDLGALLSSAADLADREWLAIEQPGSRNSLP